MHRTSEEKLIEMNKSLIADNNYLRGELNAARARLAVTGKATFNRDDCSDLSRQGEQGEHGHREPA